MTKEEAIKYLIAPVDFTTEPSTEYMKQAEAYLMAVMELKGGKRGRWVEKKGVLHPAETDGVCSCCGYATSFYNFYNFCPNCGAEMDDVEKIGHWVDHIRDFWCSECGCRILPEQVDSFSKCPQCGAAMIKK